MAETATQRLIQHGIRPSVQRVAIMQYLMDNFTHPTADTIYNDMLKIVPTLSKTTVYNTLQLLTDCNAVKAITIDKRNVHYDSRTDPHAHFMCRQCGKIFDVEVDAHLHSHLYSSDLFKIEHVELSSIGLCHECKETDED